MFLSEYLDLALARPWTWGRHDCCHFAGNWIREATGRDPLGPYRGRYATASEAGRIIMRAGGLSTLVSREMTRCGFERTLSTETGDIAVLDLPDEHGPARASVVIADGPWWVGLSRDGIAGMRADPGTIWRVVP